MCFGVVGFVFVLSPPPSLRVDASVVCRDQAHRKSVFSLNDLVSLEYNQVSHFFPTHLHSSIHLSHTVDIAMKIKDLLKRFF